MEFKFIKHLKNFIIFINVLLIDKYLGGGITLYRVYLITVKNSKFIENFFHLYFFYNIDVLYAGSTYIVVDVRSLQR